MLSVSALSLCSHNCGLMIACEFQCIQYSDSSHGIGEKWFAGQPRAVVAHHYLSPQDDRETMTDSNPLNVKLRDCTDADDTRS